jgi:trans-2-enoyl-CoA reductase
MTGNSSSKDELLEALDFIVDILKEHIKDLDKLVNELVKAINQLGDIGKLTGEVKKIGEKINGLQNEITNLVSSTSTSKQNASIAVKECESKIAPNILIQGGPPVLLQCKKWEDFQTLALQAQTISFSYKEDEKVFEVDAFMGNQIVTYTGALPVTSDVFKMWLTKQLNLPKEKF